MHDEVVSITYRPNRRRAQLAALFLGTSGLLCLMLIAALVMQVVMLKRFEAGADVTLAEALTNDNRLYLLSALDIVLYIVTGIFFMAWLYRAYQNHTELAAGPVRYSPGWAIGGFIAPILNFFRPYQIVAEVWESAAQPDPVDPLIGRPSKTIVLAWWLTFIIPTVLTRLANSMANVSLKDYLTPTLMLVIANGLLLISAGLAIRIIQTIEQAHEEWVRRECPLDNWLPAADWNPAIYLGSIGLAVAIGWVVLTQSAPTEAALSAFKNRSGSSPTPIGASKSSAATGARTATRIPDPRTPIVWATAAAKSTTPVPTRIPTRTPAAPLAFNKAAKDGRQYYEQGEYRRALLEFNKALQIDANNARYYLYRGQAYKELADAEAALKDFDRALELDATLAEAYFERGWIYFADDNYGKARSDFEQALKLDDEYPDAYVGRGMTYYALDDYARALTDFNQAVELDAAYSEAYYGRGLVYYATGEYLKSVEDFSTTVELDEEWAPAYYRRGQAYYDLDELTAARADYNHAIELDPDNATPYFDRGVLLYDLGRYQDALADFTKVLEAYPEEGSAYLWRGAVYNHLNETEKAIADLELAVKWTTDADLRHEAEDMLQELKGEKRPTS